MWTVLVYMAADNDLEDYALADLEKIKTAMRREGATRRVTVAVQFDPKTAGVTTRRYEIGAADGDFPDCDMVEDLGIDTDTGKPKVLADFIRWGVATYPARHYAVVLWSHGAGVDDTDIYATGGGGRYVRHRPRRPVVFSESVKKLFKGLLDDKIDNYLIATDDTSKDFLDNVELKRAFESAVTRSALGQEGRRIDIVAMDACYMSMAEVYHQLRDYVAYAVGSEEITPFMGWPYTEILTELCARPQMKPKELAEAMVMRYIEYYASTSPLEPVTLSACDLSQSDALKTAVDRLANMLLERMQDDATVEDIMIAHYRAQTYWGLKFVDLYDFCSMLAERSRDENVRGECRAVMQIVEHDYVIRSCQRGTAVEHSHGIALYLPHDQISPLYSNLDFSKGTGPQWEDFLKRYSQLTARQSREAQC